MSKTHVSLIDTATPGAGVARAIQAGVAAAPAQVSAVEVVALATADRPTRMQTLVRRAPDLPAWMAWVFAYDEDWWVRAVLAERIATAPAYRDVLLRLAVDRRVEVRRTLARVPGCPDWLLEALVDDPDPLVSEAVYRAGARDTAGVGTVAA